MRILTSVAGVVVAAVAAATTAFGQSAEPRDQIAPTVRGGTGLFDTYSTRTREKGEVGVGLFWNDVDREPGDVDVNQIPASVTVGLTDRWEAWANLNVWQQTTVRQPFLLSGYQYNAVEAYGLSAFSVFGPPLGGTGGGAAFFPGARAPGGGVLPSLGRFGAPIVLGDEVVLDDFPAIAGSAGVGPAILTDRAGYLPDLPFLGQVDFLGLDGFGRPRFGARESGDGVGDALVGTKVSVVDPDAHPYFSVAIGGTATIPTARNRGALARGRTSGEVDWGPFVAIGHELADGRMRVSENASYTVAGDPHVGDVKTLDRPDRLGLGIGASVGVNEHVELTGELDWTRYVGGQTPNLNQNDPLDMTLGARFYALDGRLSFGGAYRRLMNGGGDRTLPVLTLTPVTFIPAPVNVPTFLVTATPVTFPAGDRNGFVAYVGFRFGRDFSFCGTYGPSPPMCTGVTADRAEIFTGESVTLMANASDPDGDVLTYTWTATDGRVVGSGSSVTFDATGLAEGSYTVTAQTNDGFGHTVECSTTVNVRKRPNVCPTVSLSADKTTVTVGETVTFTATTSDPDDGPSSIHYEWTTSAGSLRRVVDNEVQLDTTGLDGTVTVSVTTSDGDAACRTTERTEFVVNQPVRDVFWRLENLYFARDRARIDDAMKRVLDDTAVRMRVDPTLGLVLDGNSAKGERSGIARMRAENAKLYLTTEKGIDPSRVLVRTFDDRCPTGSPEQDRRVEVYPLPQGRTAEEIEKACDQR